ncbi:hypothetical protein EGW08_018000 [Elysia chlorotica]|uniref:BESS domain-containing protein n=1 Tax=Elysia chlorotica TaxID=188477 RepID=A0A3S1AWS5_ELYCH|nr:hypothetical protein EGW08_018000 [Elysia chlorotica]
MNNSQEESASQDVKIDLDDPKNIVQTVTLPQTSFSQETWGPIIVVENTHQDESEEAVKVVEASAIETSSFPKASCRPVSLVKRKSSVPANDASPSSEKEKRKRPVSPTDPVQDAFLALIQEKRRKLAAVPKPAQEPELDIFRSLTPFIRQLSEKNKRRFVSKTTTILMDLLNAQDLAQ